MKWGLIARMDNGGLGIQTHELYKNLKPDKTLVVDMNAQTGFNNFPNRYPNATFTSFEPTEQELKRFLEGLDVVFTVEAPYNDNLFAYARALGVKSIQQYNYEFLTTHANTVFQPPDLFLAPSKWCYDRVTVPTGSYKTYLPVPVNRELLPFELKTKAHNFLHIAGHKTYKVRNGTDLLLAAIPLVQSDVQFTIRSQHELWISDPRVVMIYNDNPNYYDLYEDADVLLLPRKYGGLTLQRDEALSKGMPVIMPKVSPNEFLPNDWLIPPVLETELPTIFPIPFNEINPHDLAAKIDELATRDITDDSYRAGMLAAKLSWEHLKPSYQKMINDLAKGNIKSKL